MEVDNIIIEILENIRNLNGRGLLVGGYVRDYFLKLDSKDIDIEVYNIKYENLIKVLSKYGNVNEVGKSFGVIKLTIGTLDLDISIPREENSIGDNYTDFEIKSDPFMSYEKAFKRRDFTINALGYDPLKSKIIDIYDGLTSIVKKEIKYVNRDTFKEDPLRVFRAIQFASRFNFSIEKNTKSLLIEMIETGMLDSLSKERIYIEWNKLLLKSEKPSLGIKLMDELGILKKYYSELKALQGCEQEKKWHPEGDVWIHSLMALDEMALLLNDNDDYSEVDKLILLYGILLHDLGKPSTTIVTLEGRITSRGHEEAGVEPTFLFFSKLTNDKYIINNVINMVKYHLQPSLLYNEYIKHNKTMNKAVKRLSEKANIKLLAMVNKADSLGRTTEVALKKNTPQYDWLLSILDDIEKNKDLIKPFITGKDLIEIGLKPSSEFKDILKDFYDMQLDGVLENRKCALIELNKKYNNSINMLNL